MAKLPAEKQRILDEMKSFIEEEEKWLEEILNYVQWNIEDLKKITPANPPIYELCPINNEHRVPQDSMEAHISKCWRKHGTYPDASLVSSFNDDSASTSKTVDLSSLKPLDECSTSTSQPSTSLIELLSAERDAKRRRATYRKKGVSTNKKSYNEVLRELIDNEMKTLEFGLKTDDELKSTSTSANEERAAKKSVYAGIGNWIYHGNPYKRWMTIEEEEQKLLRSPDSTKIDDSDFRSKYSADRSCHSREDRSRDREYVDRNSRRHDRFHSRRYGHHFDNSSRHEQYSDRQKRDLFEDSWRRREKTHSARSEHRHFDERRSDFSSRQSSVCGVEVPKKESSRRSPSRDRKRHKYDEDFERVSSKSSKSHVKRESRASSKIRETEPTGNLVESVEDSRLKNPNEFDLKNDGPVLDDDTSNHEGETKLSISSRRSSSSSETERKHRKKKKEKHKKKSKKKKKDRDHR